MSVINTNYLSLVAQNNLQKSQSALGTAIERLSSGLRINSAKDDAAGQAIANRMTSQITGLNQAQRNANDGISVAQTAEGALNQVNDNLQRVRELTVQSANSTNSPDDLKSIQAEINERLTEINRISEQTDFNGVKVLGGEAGTDATLKIQVGANDDEAINVFLKAINKDSLGLTTFNVDGTGATPNKAATQADLDAAITATKNVSKTGDQYFVTTANTAVTAQDVLTSVPETIGLTVTAGAADGTALANSLGFTTTAGTVALADGLKSDGSGGFKFDVAGATAAEVATFITPASGSTAATYTAGGVTHNILLNSTTGAVTDASGQEMFITGAGELTYDNVGGTLNSATVTNLTTAINASDAATESVTLKLQNGTTVSNASGGGAINVTNVTISAADLATAIATDSLTVTTTTTAARDGAAGVDAIVLTGTGAANPVTATAGGNAVYKTAGGALTQSTAEKEEIFVRDNGNVTNVAADQFFVGADGNITKAATTAGTKTTDPLKALDAALKMVDEQRSSLGAIQNRFESAITNLQTNSTNLQAARSRIEDADYAVEVANMSKNQILQQAGTSVLAQANQIPQGVLSLLR